MATKKRDDFICHILNLQTCNRSLSQEWDSVKVDVLSTVTVDSVQVAPNQYGIYDHRLQQINIANGQVVEDLRDLLSCAAVAKAAFDPYITSLLSTIGNIAVITVPIKEAESCIDKADFNYNSRVPGPSISWLHDCVRVSVVCKTGKDVMNVFEKLRSSGSTLSIVKVKNRFIDPLPNGYRDLLVHVKYKLPERHHHICEVQIHLDKIFKTGNASNSHSLYEYYRTYFRSSHSPLSKADVDRRSQLLEQVYQIFSASNIDFQLKMFVDASIAEGDLGQLEPLQQILRRLTEYSKAEEIERFILLKQLAASGQRDDDERVLVALHGLMTVLENQGKYSEAEQVCVRLRRARLLAYGATDLRSMKVTHSLGSILHKLGHGPEAENAFREALEGKEKLLGPYHQSTLVTLDSLADVLKNLGKYSEAEIVCQQALATRERLLGPDHPLTVGTMNNLAVMQKQLGALKDAENTFCKVLEVKKRLLGEEHPSTLTTCENLAVVYEEMNEFDLAEDIFMRVFQVRVRVQDQFSPDVITSLINLANLFQKKKKFALAAKYFFEAYQKLCHTIGTGHGKTALVLQRAQENLTAHNSDIRIVTVEDARTHCDVNTAGVGRGRSFEKHDYCQNCGEAFTLLRREHHCRVCIRSICGGCSASASVPQIALKKVRVCSKCLLAVDMSSSAPQADQSSFA